MIYRIALFKDNKLIRYADANYMRYLRVSPSGRVQKIKASIFWKGEDVSSAYFKVLPVRSAHPATCAKVCCEWLDLSDTHKVEWGMLTSDKDSKLIPIYDGDIYVDWNTGIVSKPTKPEVFELFSFYNNLHPDQFPMVEIIGNVHQNPELLEV